MSAPRVAAVEAGGVALCVEEAGDGTPIVFVHGMASDRSLWQETVAALAAAGARTIAYDRRAYGGSGAPEPYGGTTVGEQADDLAELIGRLDAAPAVLCGHHLGALICLDTLVRHAPLARAAVLVETPMLWLSSQGPDVVSKTREAVAEAARERGAGAAVEAFLEEVAGPNAAAVLGDRRMRAARDAPRAFAADLAASASWPGGRRELRRVGVPVAVVSGARSTPIYREVADKLVRLIPGASAATLDSGHFGPIERPDALAAIVSAAARD
jgi:pimeloyl-ACP methyl ester carboxylesterase